MGHKVARHEAAGRPMKWQPALLIGVTVGTIIIAATVDPVPQDPNYHAFADQAALLGIPNLLNVASNLPFLIVGVLGWQLILRHEQTVTPATRIAWLVFFFGIMLTAFGSGYFHLNPNNDTLFWDRLPMTIGFMSLISIIIAEYFSEKTGRLSLLPLLLIGIGSVIYWAHSETLGRGDLRPYAVVQFLPMLLIPLIIVLYRTRSDLGRYIWWMIAFYVAAKLAEQLDDVLYAAGNLVSGHTVKHLLASLAPASLLYGLNERRNNHPRNSKK